MTHIWGVGRVWILMVSMRVLTWGWGIHRLMALIRMGGLFGLNAFYSKMVGIGLGSAVGGYIGKELIADKKDSRDSRVYAAIGGVIGGLIGGFAPELGASIGDGLRNLPNLGKVLSDAGEVIGDVGELYASARSGVFFLENAVNRDNQPNGGVDWDTNRDGVLSAE